MPVWQLEGSTARLRLDALAASVDVARPEQGITHVEIGGAPLADTRWLGVELAAPRSGGCECYVRQDDLIASYADRPQAEMRTQLYWRAAAPRIAETLAAIELLVSVQTSLLDSCPQLTAASQVVASEAYRLVDAAEFASLLPSAGASVPEPADAPHCYLFRLPGRQYSYAQMIHPADDHESHWDGWLHGTDYRLRVAHRMFSQRLEKGVILRGRVKGVLIARRDDKRATLAHWQSFLAEEPPLTV
jgi:hypothetical protein